MDDGITLRNCFGYLSEDMARVEGFTHHGSYYGIPIWITDDGVGPMVATKWAPMEYVMTAASYVEGFLNSVLYPHDEPMFMFKLLRPIEQGGASD